MVRYAHLFQNFPQFIVIHIVKGFGVVNKAEIDVFLELSCFFDDPVDAGNLISGSSAFSKTSLPWNQPPHKGHASSNLQIFSVSLFCMEHKSIEKEPRLPPIRPLSQASLVGLVLQFSPPAGAPWLIHSFKGTEEKKFMKGFGINMYTLLYFKWITNKDLLYSTRNSAQCYVAAWMGGELRGERIHEYDD